MNNRQEKILEAIINEYQKTGYPVASQSVYKKYNFGLSPATIRSEMLALDEDDFLVKPHTAAGRVPTTKAYRWFVDGLTGVQKQRIRDEKIIKKEVSQFKEEKVGFSKMAQILADLSHNLGLSGYWGDTIDFHEAGFASLMEDEELSHPENISGILRGFDALSDELISIFTEMGRETDVFIGEENPINDFRHCSLVISGYEFRNGKGFIGIMGPKRMNYARNIFLIEEAKKIIKKSNKD